MSLTREQSRAFGAHLASLHHASIYSSEAQPLVFGAARGLLRWTAERLGVGGRLPHGPDAITLPTPLGPLIVLSDAVLESPDVYAETSAHEACHAAQIEALGGYQSAIDYLLSGELRALREAHAYSVGAWVRYLLTGQVLTLDDAMAALSGGLYLLNDAQIELARGIVASGLASIAAGATPPYRVALDAVRWLRCHAPDAIMPVAQWAEP